MSNWTQFSLAAPLKPVTDTAKKIADITSTIATIIGIHKTALQIIATLTTNLLNAEALLIKAALSVIEKILDQYIVTDANMHMLVVPIRKRPPWNLQSDFQIPPEETSWLIDETINEAERKAFLSAATRIATYDRGNEGFLRTVYEETLDDDNDPNRPQYDASAAYTATIIVAGAQTLTGVFDMMRLLHGIMGTAFKGNELIPSTIIKTPQNLRGKISAVENSTQAAVLLEWENPASTQTFSEYSGLRVRLDELSIIRSENDEMAIAKDWLAFFGGDQPTALAEGTEPKKNVLESDDKKSKVIFQTRYEGVRDVYADTDTTLEKEKDYYYAIAYRYAVAEEPGSDGKITWISMNYIHTSNVIKMRFRKTTPKITGGTQPDWITHPSPLELIPSLKFFMLSIKTQIEALKSMTTGAASALQGYITFLTAEAKRYADYAANINAQVAKLSSMLQIPTTGIYITTINASSGGTYSFLQELTKRMTDETDTSAPPFHRNGYVMGLVFFAGAPNPAKLVAFKTLMSLLFGGGSAATTFEQALDSIDRLLDTVEEKLFGVDMQPTTTTSTATTAYKTFDDSMTPVAADNDDANVPFDP